MRDQPSKQAQVYGSGDQSRISSNNTQPVRWNLHECVSRPFCVSGSVWVYLKVRSLSFRSCPSAWLSDYSGELKAPVWLHAALSLCVVTTFLAENTNMHRSEKL